jgi:heat shock protein HslJ
MNWKKLVLLGLSMSALFACVQEIRNAPDITGAPEVVGTLWQWQTFQDAADGDESRDIMVPDPTRFTLTLQSDNSVNIQADCNRLRWTYTLQESSLSFDTLGPGTRAYCGEDSLDVRYLELLGNAATYVMADGKLYLNLKYDSGNMIFIAGE